MLGWGAGMRVSVGGPSDRVVSSDLQRSSFPGTSRNPLGTAASKKAGGFVEMWEAPKGKISKTLDAQNQKGHRI